MKFSVIIGLLACFAGFGQTTTPSITLPTAISVTGEFNQLSTPQWAMGLSALYTTTAQGSIGMYNTSTADVIPIRATDPATGKQFWALSAQFRQGVHEKILATGKFRFLLGGDIGPGFSSTASGISVSATGSFVATGLYRVNNWLSVVVPVRMLYVSGIGWNPVVQAGLSFNLGKLPKAN
ncbi:MAG: hypothetical protein ABSF62_02420 [Bryobacteraceae bacterium]|jgi:hypothetical protein